MTDKANELIQSWINGNRNTVIITITQEPSKIRAALLSALVFNGLNKEDQGIYLTLLANKLQ